MFAVIINLGIVAIVCFLGALIANLIFAFSFNQFFIENSIFQYINRDLNTKLIYKITQRDKCEEGEETLVIGTWFGSINKCQCSPQRILNNDCTDENRGCTTISGEPKNYTKFYDKFFCVVREGKTYKELILANQIKNADEKCPENYDYCGVIDTLFRKLCVKKGDKCPITINNMFRTYSFNEYYTNNNQFNHKENLELFINELNEYVDNSTISLIEVGETFPCMNYSQKVWTTYDANDRNDVTSCSNIGGEEYDYRFIKIKGFEINKADFYKNNELDAYITEEFEKLHVNLYGRVLFGLYYNGENINYERMVEIQENVNTYGTAINIITKVMFILFIAPIALVVFCLGLAGSGLAAGGGSCDCGDICKSVLIFLGGDFGISVGLGNIANYIVCCLMLKNLIELKGIIKAFKNSDEYTNILVESIMNSINKDFNFSLAIVIITSFSLFLVLLGGIYFVINRFLLDRD